MEWFLSLPKMASATMADLTVEVNEEIQLLLIEQELAPGTVDKYMATWRRFLRKCAIDWTYMPVPPKVPMLNKDVDEPRWFTPIEYGEVYTELGHNQRPKAHFAVHTGLRMRAMLSLKIRNVDIPGKRAWIEKQFMKSGRTHAFPLSSEAIRALRMEQQFRAEQHADHVRRCKRLGKAPGRGDTEHVFTYRLKPLDDCNTLAFQNSLERAGINEANWHTFRHTFASWAVQSGVTLQELMELGPWESYEMVLRYAHLQPSKLVEAVSRVAQMGHSAKLADALGS